MRPRRCGGRRPAAGSPDASWWRARRSTAGAWTGRCTRWTWRAGRPAGRLGSAGSSRAECWWWATRCTRPARALRAGCTPSTRALAGGSGGLRRVPLARRWRWWTACSWRRRSGARWWAWTRMPAPSAGAGSSASPGSGWCRPTAARSWWRRWTRSSSCAPPTARSSGACCRPVLSSRRGSSTGARSWPAPPTRWSSRSAPTICTCTGARNSTRRCSARPPRAATRSTRPAGAARSTGSRPTPRRSTPPRLIRPRRASMRPPPRRRSPLRSRHSTGRSRHR